MAAPGGVGSRREARERALSLLYEAEAKDCDARQVLASLPLEPDPFAAEVVRGVAEDREVADEIIRRYSRGWSLERMPVVDRNLLRMAIFELSRRPDVPTGAILSEAVDLAKRYSTEDSGRFVNGMLASIATELRPPSEADADAS